MRLATVDFCSYNESVAAAFDKIDAGNTLEKQSAILIKPNLTNSSPHPVTTPDVLRFVKNYHRPAAICLGQPAPCLNQNARISNYDHIIGPKN